MACCSGGGDIVHAQPEYVLGHGNAELDRLIAQSSFFGDLTEQLFARAGLAPGMHVLDVGCGVGDVSFLAARFVGPSGRVLGIDRSDVAISRATERATAAALSNVRFEAGDIADLHLAEPVDAVVGRLILLYLPDPSRFLASLSKHLKPGGLVVFQEMDMSSVKASPPCRLFDETMGRVREAFRRSGTDPEIGLKLGPIFARAGFASTKMMLGARIEYSDRPVVCEQLTGIARTMLPAMERTGIATAQTVGIDTLSARLLEEAVARDATLVSPSLVGAWTRTA
jgi:SAM-dependent methyltransferase